MNNPFGITTDYCKNLDQKYHEYNSAVQWKTPTVIKKNDKLLIKAETDGTLGCYKVEIHITKELGITSCRFTCSCPFLRTKTKRAGTAYDTSCKHGAGLCFAYIEEPNEFQYYDMNDTNTFISSKTHLELVESIFKLFQIDDELTQDSILEVIRNMKDKKTKNKRLEPNSPKTPTTPNTPKSAGRMTKIEKSSKIPKKISSLDSSPFHNGSQNVLASPNDFLSSQDYLSYFNSQLSQDSNSLSQSNSQSCSELNSQNYNSQSLESLDSIISPSPNRGAPNLNFLNYLENKMKKEQVEETSVKKEKADSSVGNVENKIDSQKSTQEYSETSVKQEEEDNCLVFDIGSSSSKIGISGEEKPFAIIPSFLKNKQNSKYINKMNQMNSDFLDVDYPIKRGVIHNWNDYESLISLSFEKLNQNSFECPVIFSKSPIASKIQNSKVQEIMFETFNVKGFLSENSGNLVGYSAGTKSSFVLDSGYGISYCQGSHAGNIIDSTLSVENFGGCDITDYLISLTGKSRNQVEMMKENLCEISINNDELKSDIFSEEIFELSDEIKVSTGSERFMATELLFQPHLNDLHSNGIHQIISDSIMTIIDEKHQKLMLNNMVLSGGNCCFDGLKNYSQIAQSIS
eukprot:gene8982-1081_t